MAKTNILRDLAQFTGILASTGLDPRCIEQAVENVTKLIQAFEEQPENRAGRRVRKPVRKSVRRTLTHLSSAARHVGGGSASRAEARRLIRYAGCCDDFTALEREASRYRGRHNKIMRGINDRKAREAAREIWLDDDHSVLEVRTVSHLRSVGKRLRNCIGGELGSDYRDQLRQGESEFWALRRQGKHVGLLEVDTESRRIKECLGMANEPVGWKRGLFLELQRAVDADGDHVDEFIESGAFNLFVHQPNLRPALLHIGERTYQVWNSGGVLILCDDRKRWSQFKLALRRHREFPSWEGYYGSALEVDEMVCLVALSPDLAKLISQNLPENQEGDSGRTVGRRRRRRPAARQRRPRR